MGNDQQRAAMQMALEALEVLLTCKHGEFCDHYRDAERQSKKAITALREALAQHPMDYDQGFVDGVEEGLAMAQPQEPVAWGWRDPDGYISDCICPDEHDRIEGDYTVPLYTTPPSVEAAIEATKEKAANVCEGFVPDSNPAFEPIEEQIAAAIRSMK